MWIGRRWRNARAWYGRRLLLIRILLAFAFLLLPGLCVMSGLIARGVYQYWFDYTVEDRDFLRTQAVHQEGLPSAARRLKAEMEPISDPDGAVRMHPDWVALRFSNGEWVLGYGINSHAQFRVGRGTLVVKDSRGQVHCLFGHVCGEKGATWAFHYAQDGLGVTKLDDFYHHLQSDLGFREWVPES